jgi:hypothetical protein
LFIACEIIIIVLYDTRIYTRRPIDVRRVYVYPYKSGRGTAIYVYSYAMTKRKSVKLIETSRKTVFAVPIGDVFDHIIYTIYVILYRYKYGRTHYTFLTGRLVQKKKIKTYLCYIFLHE